MMFSCCFFKTIPITILFAVFLAEASRSDKPLKDAIADLLELEYIPRKERMAKTRLKVSGIPQVKRLEDFELSWPKGGLTEKKLKELSSLAFIQRKENVILMGPSGLGKTHLMLALACKVCMTGYTAYHITCMELIEGLIRAKNANRLKRKLQWYRKPHLLVVDETGYENLDQEQATLFFQLINTRYEHGSVIMTTNKPFSSWDWSQAIACCSSMRPGRDDERRRHCYRYPGQAAAPRTYHLPERRILPDERPIESGSSGF